MAKSHCTCTCIKSSKFDGDYHLRGISYNSHISLKYMLAIIFKAFLIFLLFIFFAYFYLSKSCMGIKEREKKIPNDGNHLKFQFCYTEAHKCHWHCTFTMSKHTCVILWLAGNSGEMIIYDFLLGFFSVSCQ